MDFVRKSAVVSLSSLFSLFLLIAVLTYSLTGIATHPAKLKSWLNDSGIYETAVPAIINHTNSDQEAAVSDTEGEVPLDNQEVKNIASDVFDAQFLQSAAEDIIDGTYSWLEGKTDKPSFTVPVGDYKTKFADGLNAYLKQRMAGLPICSAAATPDSFDPFKATCLPAGVNADSEIDRITDEVRDNKEFLPDATFTADSIHVKDDGQNKKVEQAYASAPAQYQRLKLAPLIAGLLALSSAVGLYFVSKSKRQAIKRLSTILGIVGGLLLISVLFVNRILGTIHHNIQGTDVAADLKKTGVFLIDKLGGVINSTSLLFGSLFLALAIGGFAYLRLSGNTKPPQKPADPDLKPVTG